MKPILYIAFSLDPLPSEIRERLLRIATGYEIIAGLPASELEPVLDRVEICLGWLPRPLLYRLSGLKWYQEASAGVDWLLDLKKPLPSQPIITGASGVHPVQITEHVFAFILAWNRRLHLAIRAQSDHRYPNLPKERFDDLPGKTLLIYGIGAIGARVAEIGCAFGLRTIGVRRDTSHGVPGVERLVAPDRLLEVLPEADYIVNAAPFHPSTRHAFSTAQFSAMKPGAFFVNIGRGGTVDEPALIHALQSGLIAGAGLDVFATEPLPDDSPLYRLENVMLTGHYAGRSIHYNERLLQLFLENLQRFLRDEPLLNRHL